MSKADLPLAELSDALQHRLRRAAAIYWVKAGTGWIDAAAAELGVAYSTASHYPQKFRAGWREALAEAQPEVTADYRRLCYDQLQPLIEGGDVKAIDVALRDLREREKIATPTRVEVDDVTPRRLESMTDDELRERAYRGIALKAV